MKSEVPKPLEYFDAYGVTNAHILFKLLRSSLNPLRELHDKKKFLTSEIAQEIHALFATVVDLSTLLEEGDGLVTAADIEDVLQRVVSLHESIVTLVNNPNKKRGMINVDDAEKLDALRNKYFRKVADYLAKDLTQQLLTIYDISYRFNGRSSIPGVAFFIDGYRDRSFAKNMQQHIKRKLLERPELMIKLYDVAQGTREEFADVLGELLQDYNTNATLNWRELVNRMDSMHQYHSDRWAGWQLAEHRDFSAPFLAALSASYHYLGEAQVCLQALLEQMPEGAAGKNDVGLAFLLELNEYLKSSGLDLFEQVGGDYIKTPSVKARYELIAFLLEEQGTAEQAFESLTTILKEPENRLKSSLFDAYETLRLKFTAGKFSVIFNPNHFLIKKFQEWSAVSYGSDTKSFYYELYSKIFSLNNNSSRLNPEGARELIFTALTQILIQLYDKKIATANAKERELYEKEWQEVQQVLDKQEAELPGSDINGFIISLHERFADVAHAHRDLKDFEAQTTKILHAFMEMMKASDATANLEGQSGEDDFTADSAMLDDLEDNKTNN